MADNAVPISGSVYGRVSHKPILETHMERQYRAGMNHHRMGVGGFENAGCIPGELGPLGVDDLWPIPTRGLINPYTENTLACSQAGQGWL